MCTQQTLFQMLCHKIYKVSESQKGMIEPLPRNMKTHQCMKQKQCCCYELGAHQLEKSEDWVY